MEHSKKTLEEELQKTSEVRDESKQCMETNVKVHHLNIFTLEHSAVLPRKHV